MTTTPEPGSNPAVEVGAVINDLMWRKRVTQTRLGAAVGIGQSTMAKKLRGITPITVPELFAIAGCLGVTPDEILRACRDSNPKPSVWEPRVIVGGRVGRQARLDGGSTILRVVA
jgi:transcriptional regulator with XRE-family HTH domain